MAKKWTKEIPGCFGVTDKLFARHASEEGRAFAMLTMLRRKELGWAEVRKEFRNFLAIEGCSVSHISKELKRLEEYYRPWLAD